VIDSRDLLTSGKLLLYKCLWTTRKSCTVRSVISISNLLLFNLSCCNPCPQFFGASKHRIYLGGIAHITHSDTSPNIPHIAPLWFLPNITHVIHSGSPSCCLTTACGLRSSKVIGDCLFKVVSAPQVVVNGGDEGVADTSAAPSTTDDTDEQAAKIESQLHRKQERDSDGKRASNRLVNATQAI